MNEHIFPKESFIGGWYIPEKICDDLINYFDKNNGARFGVTKLSLLFNEARVNYGDEG